MPVVDWRVDYREPVLFVSLNCLLHLHLCVQLFFLFMSDDETYFVSAWSDVAIRWGAMQLQ